LNIIAVLSALSHRTLRNPEDALDPSILT
jgi:hypothetical protein